MFTNKNIQMHYRDTNEIIKLSDHYHNFYEMIYVKTGECEFLIDKKVYHITKPTLVFINHLETHSMKVLQVPYCTYYLLIKNDVLNTFLQEPLLSAIFKYRPHNYSHIIEVTEYEDLINKLFDNMYKEYTSNDPLSPVAFKAFIQYLFVNIYRKYPEYFPTKIKTQIYHTVLEVQEYIDKNYTEDIGLEKICELFFISPSYLSRSFKEITGYNLKEYIVLQRLSKAKELLLYSRDTINEICEKAGFNNVNHFIRTFKAHYNVTPYEYRITESSHKR